MTERSTCLKAISFRFQSLKIAANIFSHAYLGVTDSATCGGNVRQGVRDEELAVLAFGAIEESVDGLLD